MNRKLKADLKTALHFDVQSTDSINLLIEKGQQELDNAKKNNHISFFKMMFNQVKFIGWKIWLTQFLLCILIKAIFIYLEIYEIKNELSFVLWTLSILTTAMIIPLVYRSVRYRMFEIEGATWFSLRKILLARILLFYIGGIGMLFVIGRLSKIFYSASLKDILIWLVMPGFFCGAGLLHFLRKVELEKLKNFYPIFCLAIFAIFFILRLYGTKLISSFTVSKTLILISLASLYGLNQMRQMMRYDSVIVFE